jgi:hypothetical protein
MAKKKPNFLSSAEIQAEGNYNMVGDGIINNVGKPSLLERLEEFEKRKHERHKDDRLDNMMERHKADFQVNQDDR